jgi:CubicO group peptidase (beta-lactamase class C family)
LAGAFFEPLGMKHTGNHRTGRPVPGQALGYACEDGTVRRAVEWDLSRLVGAGSLYSTAGDLHRWNEAVFNGEVLSPASLDAAFTVGFVDGDDARYPEETGYGMGWTIETLRGQRVIGHGGELPGFGGYLLRLPTRQLTVVVLVNCVPHLPGLQQWALARRIAEVSLGRELPPEPARKWIHP